MKINLKHFILNVIVTALGVTAVFAAGRLMPTGYNQNKEELDGKTLGLSEQFRLSFLKEDVENVSNDKSVYDVLEEVELEYDAEYNNQTDPAQLDSMNPQTETVEITEGEIIREEIFKSEELSDQVIEKITGKSYKSGDSLPVEELRHLTLTYIDYAGEMQYGSMIVNKEVAWEVIDIFKELYDAKFPIEKMELIDEYDGDDILSMKDNNTSAYNHRVIAGSNTLSYHAKGLAIDINPLYNPYVKGDFVSPEEGAEYVMRTMSTTQNGMIVKGDACYNAFVKRGWSWGGDWNSSKDYQHFEKPEHFR